jgi:hypothetical protein
MTSQARLFDFGVNEPELVRAAVSKLLELASEV